MNNMNNLSSLNTTSTTNANYQQYGVPPSFTHINTYTANMNSNANANSNPRAIQQYIIPPTINAVNMNMSMNNNHHHPTNNSNSNTVSNTNASIHNEKNTLSTPNRAEPSKPASPSNTDKVPGKSLTTSTASPSNSSSSKSTGKRRSRSEMEMEMEDESVAEQNTKTNQSASQSTSSPNIKNSKDKTSGNHPATAPTERVSKRRKLCTLRGSATNRVWRQTRQNAKFKLAIHVLDGFRQEHGGKLPSLRAVMKMLKVGFPKAHEILEEYAKHVGVSKDKVIQDMTIRQEKKNKNEEVNKKNRRMNRNMFEYPINVNGKLQENIMALIHQKKIQHERGIFEQYNKLERNLSEFEIFYTKFALPAKVRIGQSYFMLAEWYFYDKRDHEISYEYVEKALQTFRDCNFLALQQGGHSVTTIDQEPPSNDIRINRANINLDDVGHFWYQIFQIYLLGGSVLLDNKQYYDAKCCFVFAWELAKYIIGSTRMDLMVALEKLSHVAMIEGNLNECEGYLNEIMQWLQIEEVEQERKQVNVTGNDGEDEKEKDKAEENQIKLLNVKAYYSCILSLYCYQNHYNQDLAFQMNKAMTFYHEVLKECREKFGEAHKVTVAVHLYFGLHFVKIEKLELAFTHIDYIKTHCMQQPEEQEEGAAANEWFGFKEKKVFQQLLTSFIQKLLQMGNLKSNRRARLFNNEPFKRQCLQIFEYQLLNTDELNVEILARQKQLEQEKAIKREKQTKMAEQEKEKEKSHKAKIKKERKSGNGEEDAGDEASDDEDGEHVIRIKQEDGSIAVFRPKPKEVLRVIDKNEIILTLHIKCLLYKFRDFMRCQQAIDNFESQQITLTDEQSKQLAEIKQDLHMMRREMHSNGGSAQMHGNLANHGVHPHHHAHAEENFNNMMESINEESANKSHHHGMVSPDNFMNDSHHHHHSMAAYHDEPHHFGAIPNFLQPGCD